MSSKDYNNKWAEIRKAALVRDKHRCQNCVRDQENVEALEVHHIVPRSAGGSNRLSNLKTLCRECHEAVHGETIAPTVEITSSHNMSSEEFTMFRHFIKEMLPAVVSKHKVRIEPIFIEETNSWNIPVADLKLLDDQISGDEDIRIYDSPIPVKSGSSV